MSDSDNYAPGTYSDPNAPWNYDNPRDTDEFQDEQLRQWNERIRDTYGYQQDAYTDAPRDARSLLTAALLEDDDLVIGKLFRNIIREGCKPDDESILEVLNEEPYDPEA